MSMTSSTILITGGTSGIGLELADQLIQLGNTVIVTGREPAKLQATKQRLPQVHTIQSDVSDSAAITALFRKVTQEFPQLNVLINNAGIMRKIDLQIADQDLNELTKEIETNLMGPIRMVTQFLPHLKTQKSATIMNVSSGLAFVPLAISPVYSATKAAMHSFTQSLRIQLRNTNVNIIELAPPGTETPLFRGDFTEADLGGIKGLDVKVLARHAIQGMDKKSNEIRPGVSNMLKIMSRVAPGFIANQLGKSVKTMHAKS